MMSTHMAYGFVSAYALTLLFAFGIAPSVYPVVMPITALLALAGLLGAALPDVDQLEFWGPVQIRKYFVHKKTLHYLSGYLIATVILVTLAVFISQYLTLLLLLACGSFAAWVHSIMDPLDGWRDDNPKQGIYEHLTCRWLPSLRLIMFAGMWEWVTQALATVGFIAISGNLSQLVVPGWQVATLTYFVIWAISAGFDGLYRAAKRQPREREHIRSFRGLR
jgi:hypothetical protein